MRIALKLVPKNNVLSTSPNLYKNWNHNSWFFWFFFLPFLLFFISDQDKFDATQDYKKYANKGDPWNNDLSSLKNHVRALHSLHQLSLAVESKKFQSTDFSGIRSPSSSEESDNLFGDNFSRMMLNDGSKKTDTEIYETIINRENVNNTDFKSYDAIIFIRPDVRFISDVPVKLLSHYPDTLFVPDFHRSCSGNKKCNTLFSSFHFSWTFFCHIFASLFFFFIAEFTIIVKCAFPSQLAK